MSSPEFSSLVGKIDAAVISPSLHSPNVHLQPLLHTLIDIQRRQQHFPILIRLLRVDERIVRLRVVISVDVGDLHSVAQPDDLRAWLEVLECGKKQSQLCHIREDEPERVVLHPLPPGLPLVPLLSGLLSVKLCYAMHVGRECFHQIQCSNISDGCGDHRLSIAGGFQLFFHSDKELSQGKPGIVRQVLGDFVEGICERIFRLRRKHGLHILQLTRTFAAFLW